MTQDEIIRMALSAGMHYQPRFDAPTGYLFKNREALERFAELVAEATKERCAGMIDNDDIHRGKWFAERIRELK